MKSLQKLSQQFIKHKLSFALITTGFFTIVITHFTRFIANDTGAILTMIALVIFFVGIILRICNPKNLNHFQKWLYWTPRIFITFFGLFLTILLMFGSIRSFRTPPLWDIGLFMLFCFVPALFVIITLLFSRIWNWIGGLFFILIGLVILVLYLNQGAALGNYLLITLPLIVIGLLFLLDWWYSPKLIPVQKLKE